MGNLHKKVDEVRGFGVPRVDRRASATYSSVITMMCTPPRAHGRISLDGPTDKNLPYFVMRNLAAIGTVQLWMKCTVIIFTISILPVGGHFRYANCR